MFDSVDCDLFAYQNVYSLLLYLGVHAPKVYGTHVVVCVCMCVCTPTS